MASVDRTAAPVELSRSPAWTYCRAVLFLKVELCFLLLSPSERCSEVEVPGLTSLIEDDPEEFFEDDG